MHSHIRSEYILSCHTAPFIHSCVSLSLYMLCYVFSWGSSTSFNGAKLPLSLPDGMVSFVARQSNLIPEMNLMIPYRWAFSSLRQLILSSNPSLAPTSVVDDILQIPFLPFLTWLDLSNCSLFMDVMNVLPPASTYDGRSNLETLILSYNQVKQTNIYTQIGM